MIIEVKMQRIIKIFNKIKISYINGVIDNIEIDLRFNQKRKERLERALKKARIAKAKIELL